MRVGRHCTWTLVLVFGSGACAHAIKETAKSATPAVVEGATEKASEPNVRDRIAEVLSDEQIRKASAEMSQAIADGVLEALADPDRAARFRAVADGMVHELGSTAAKSLRTDLGPAIAGVVASSVDQSLATALDRDRLEAASLAIARGTLRGMAAGMQETAGGAPGSNGIVRLVSRDAAFGVQDAMRQSAQARSAGERGARHGNVLALGASLADAAFALSPWLLVMFGSLLAIAIAIAIGIVWRLSGYRKQSRAREHAVHLLAKAIHRTEHEPWAEELKQRIREAVDDDSAPSADESREVLLRHLELRQSH